GRGAGGGGGGGRGAPAGGGGRPPGGHTAAPPPPSGHERCRSATRGRMRFAERMGRLTTAASFDMLARGRALEAAGRSIIHLGIGEPDFATPAFIPRAADDPAAAGWTH